MRQLTSDQLGTAGEREFYRLIDPTLHCNRVGEDRTGWDFYVEWPNDYNQVLTYDLQPKPLSCHIQVKAKWDDSDWIRAPLSSFARLAKEPKPCFVYVLSWDKNKRPASGRIIPMRGQFLADILRQQRKAFIDGRKLNDATYRFKPEDWGEPLALDSESLKRYVERHVGADLDAFLAAKKFEYDNLGYEEGRAIVRGQILAVDRDELRSAYISGTAIQAVIEAAVDTRFGLEVPIPNIPVGPSTVRFDGNNGSRAKLQVWPSSLEVPAEFRGKWFRLPQAMVEPGYGEGIFKADVFSLSIKKPLADGDDGLKLNLLLDGTTLLDSKLKPGQWHDFHRFMVGTLDGPVRTWLKVEGRPDFSGEMRVNQPLEGQSYYRRMVGLCETIERACRIAGVPNAKLTINDIYGQKDALTKLGAWLANEEGTANFGTDLLDFLKGGEVLPMLYIGTIPLGDFALVFALELEFVSEIGEAEVTWNGKTKKVHGIIRTPAPTGELADPGTVALLDRLRISTGIDNYYLDGLPKTGKIVSTDA